MSPLPVFAFLLAIAPRAEGMMRPPQLAQGGQETPASLVEDLVGAGGSAVARRTCAPQFDYLKPTSADPLALLSTGKQLDAKAHGSDVLERRSGSRGRSSGRVARPCPQTRTPIKSLMPLLLPEYKLAFCYIPKVACSQFKDLFNQINGEDEDTIGFGHDYFASGNKVLEIKMKNVTKENGWKFATFTRDPALRYLSAFGDTCTVENHTASIGGHAWSCCGELLNVELPLDVQRKNFRSRTQMDWATGLPKNEQHWALQKEILENCGWHKFKPENLDYWGMLHGDVTSQVKEMLRMVDYENDTLVERFFPQDEAAGHHGQLTGEPYDYIKDLDVLEGIVEIYEEDFKAFPGIGCAFTEPLLAKLRANASSGNASSL